MDIIRLLPSACHPEVQIAMGDLHSAIRKYTNWTGAQITYDHLREPERTPTVDVKVLVNEEES